MGATEGSLPERLFPQIPRPATGLHVLGVSFGDASSLEPALDDAYIDGSRGLDELPELGDAQVAFTLLRQCAAARPRYLQRVLYPSPEVLRHYHRFDRQLQGVAADLFSIELTPLDACADLWAQQASLPIKWGGLGLGDLSALAPVAHLSCWAQVRPLLASRFSINSLLALGCAFNDASLRQFPSQEAICSAFAQLPAPVQALFLDSSACGLATASFSPATLAALVWDGAFRGLLGVLGTPGEVAHVRSVSSPAAGAWLHPIPSSFNTAFGNAEFLSTLRLGLGLADPAWTGLACLCGQATPTFEHVLRCGVGSPGRISVLHALRYVVPSIAAQAGLQVQVEPVGNLPLRPGDSIGRRSDVAISDRVRCIWRLLNVAICSPLSLYALPFAATTTEAGAAHAEARKRHNYADAPPTNLSSFLPLSCMGAWGRIFTLS